MPEILKARFPKEETRELYEKEIDALFEEAKKTDEREFVIANLYFNGVMQINDQYDVKKELDKTLDGLFELIAIKEVTQSNNAFIKLLLLIYCQIIEFYLFYTFIYGLFDIISGESFDIGVFNKEKTFDYTEPLRQIEKAVNNKELGNQDKAEGINSILKPVFNKEVAVWDKIKKITKKAKPTKSQVPAIIKTFYDNEIRNAFSHNLCTVSAKELYLIKTHRSIPMLELIEKIINCFVFYQYLTIKSQEIVAKLKDKQFNDYTGKYGQLRIETVWEDKTKYHFRISGSSVGKSF